jgi:hypothetical protein
MEDRIGGAPRHPPLVFVKRGVHVAVETKTAALVRARKGRNHVRPIGVKGKLGGLETLPAKPIVNVIRHRALAAGRAVDVSEIERDLEELLNIDLIEHLLRVDVHCITMPVRPPSPDKPRSRFANAASAPRPSPHRGWGAMPLGPKSAR